MAMDHVGTLVALEHELQRGAAEEGEPLIVIGVAIEGATIKEILVGVRLDEETLAAVNEPEIHAAMNGVMIPRHPEVLEVRLQIENLIVAQAIVLRQDDLHGIAPDFQLAGQPEHHVAQAAHLGYGSALRRDLDDIHFPDFLSSPDYAPMLFAASARGKMR